MLPIKLNNNKNEIQPNGVKIKDIYNVENATFIKLANYQNILCVNNKFYDVSEYDDLQKIFKLGRKLCGVFINGFTLYVVNLKTNKVLFKSSEAYYVSKNDDKTLFVSRRGSQPSSLYNLKTKSYISVPLGYEFDRSLGEGLYIFNEKDKGSDAKRCVINLNGEILLSDVKGYLYLNDIYLVNSLKTETRIMNLKTQTIKTIKKDEKWLTNPEYYDGKIYIITKDKLNVLNLELEEITNYPMKNINEIVEIQLTENIFKIRVETTYKGRVVGKHYFLNLINGELLDHLRIEAAPHWEPKILIGYDEIGLDGEEVERDYHFYDLEYKKIATIKGTSFYWDGFEDRLFIVESDNSVKLLNSLTKTVHDISYSSVHFNTKNIYGYGFNDEDESMDFFDDNLNVIIKGFKYKKYCTEINDMDFKYFILNNYVCITNYFTDGNFRTRVKCIVINPEGEVILEKYIAKCFELDNMIRILTEKGSIFINTLNGQMGEIYIDLPLNENNKIDINNLAKFNEFFLLSNSTEQAITRKLSPKE